LGKIVKAKSDAPDWHDRQVRWTVAASTSDIGHAALDAAIATYPSERFTLRNGIMTIRQFPKLRRDGSSASALRHRVARIALRRLGAHFPYHRL
jgi:hypothetical protein